MTGDTIKTADSTRHVPVMTAEVLEYLKAAQGGVFLDVTLGGGGHSRAILDANPANYVVACDRDAGAVERAEKLFSKEQEEGRMEIHRAEFSELSSLFRNMKFNGILADLGPSTDQFFSGRGFSFNDEGPLDMRMNQEAAFSAAEVVNSYSESDLFKMLKKGGVGREARAVSQAIVAKRPFASTRQLADVVAAAARRFTAAKKVHPATVTFQAIRMEVNGETEQIEALLKFAPSAVREGARLAVITFHSLEDKLVTRTMRDWEGSTGAPAWWPGAATEYVDESRKLGHLVQRKAIAPGEEEVKKNPSARSSRLRVFEFIAK